MTINNALPPDLQRLTRIANHHAGKNGKTKCVRDEDNTNGWIITTTADPSDTARMARCLFGCEVKIHQDGNSAQIQSGSHQIRILRPDHLAIRC